ncbi:hypothetical protein L8O13_04400 [Enterobacter roggenkampii]|nr:hypothetical protein [Enterobacter roggenkampii]
MGQAGHLTGRFFPIAGKIIVKCAASMMAAFFFRHRLFWSKVLEKFWRREKVENFQGSKNIPPSE